MELLKLRQVLSAKDALVAAGYDADGPRHETLQIVTPGVGHVVLSRTPSARAYVVTETWLRTS